MSTTETLATGARLTPETFADFIQRLEHHHRDDGVKWHHTADPIFTVQKHHTIYGLDLDYADGRFVALEDRVWFSPQEYWNDLEQEEREAINADCLENHETPFTSLDEDDQWSMLESFDDHTVSGYRREWQFLNAHLTKEAAEAFIARKQHDYPPLRVYVESMYFGWEYKELMAALLDGRLVLVEKAQ